MPSGVAADSAGNFVVAWESYGQDGSEWGVFGQRYDSAGSEVGSEVPVNSYTISFQRFPAVAADGSGNFVVAWQSLSSQDDPDWGVFGQRYDSAGSEVGSEFQVNSYTTNIQYRPSVAADSSGNFVVWESQYQDGSNWGVFGRKLTARIFADGFDVDGVCAWSTAVGASDC